MRVLGIDPGTAITGYGVVEGEGNDLRTLTHGVVTTPADWALPQRLQEIYTQLRRLASEWQPDSTAVEELFFSKNARTALTVGHGRGVVLLALADAGLSIHEYKPAEVKGAVTGYGSAPKRQVQTMVQQLLGLSEIPRPDDAADALAYGCTGLLGLQWRTRIIGPNIAALAQAGWSQSPWNPKPGQLPGEDALTVPRSLQPPGGTVYPTLISGRRKKGPRGQLPSDDFWADWARALFGDEAGKEIGALFTRIDGRLPRSGAAGCPAGLRADSRPYAAVALEYAFVDELRRLGVRVQGAGNRERFDYWLNTLEYLRDVARLECAIGQFKLALRAATKPRPPDPGRAAAVKAAVKATVAAYRTILAAYRQAYERLLATVNTNGALATVMYWESAYYPKFIAALGQRLAALTGEKLPPGLELPTSYQGPPRLIVPTVQSVLTRGERLEIKAIALSATPVKSLALHWRRLGGSDFAKLPAEHVARGVHKVTLPAEALRDDIEYYIELKTDARSVTFPATAPAINQTVVVVPAEKTVDP